MAQPGPAHRWRGHAPHEETPEQLANLLEQFLSGLG
jgi:hypothetical protein